MKFIFAIVIAMVAIGFVCLMAEIVLRRRGSGQVLSRHAQMPEPVRQPPKVPPAPKAIQTLQPEDLDWLGPQVDLYRERKQDGVSE